MSLLVRSWNLYHGMAVPAGRRSHLEEAVRMVSADAPDVLCLQEVPLWGFSALESWSGMQAFCVRAQRTRLPRRLGGWITRLNQRLFRSALAGQGNALLLRRGLTVVDQRSARISRGLRERRVCQVLRMDGMAIGNVHCSGVAGSPQVAVAELGRSLALLRATALRGETLVLAGDFNLRPEQLPSLPGWSGTGPGIDHILVRGADATALDVWPLERRVCGGEQLSDHAPVELRIGG
ncbi:MAG: endonuclease/exonuclease/phosphatase family protein [Gaiellaceae bacterium]